MHIRHTSKLGLLTIKIVGYSCYSLPCDELTNAKETKPTFFVGQTIFIVVSLHFENVFMVNAKQVFERIQDLYGFKNLTELSKYFEKNGNWAASMIKNDSPPYPICVQACLEKNVSLDWLIFGENKAVCSKKELLSKIEQGLFEANALNILEQLSAEQIVASSVLVLKQIEQKICLES